MAEPNGTARISGQLPGGPEFSASALRVGDRVCIAGPPQWMSVEQAQRAAGALLVVSRD